MDLTGEVSVRLTSPVRSWFYRPGGQIGGHAW